MPRETDQFPIRGLDLTTPGHQLESGACRLLWDLVPTGRGEGAVWEVPKMAEERGAFTGLLSVGWFTDPSGSAGERIVALTEAGVSVIDPSASYSASEVWSFAENDPTRRATFAQVAGSMFVAVTSGPDQGTPEVLLEVVNTGGAFVAQRMKWAPLPRVSIAGDPPTGDNNRAAGRVAFRVAWRLDDGTLGPISPPQRLALPDVDSVTVRATVEAFDVPLTDLWDDRIDELVLIGHPDVQATRKYGIDRTTVPPEQGPGYVVAAGSEYTVGDSIRWTGTFDDIPAGETIEGRGLADHERRAGVVYGYNQRLMLGDVEYNLVRPPLRKILDWEDGVSNANGDDWHLVLQVEVETQNGIRRRRSEPLPFDNSSINSVSTRHGFLWYPDPRARRYQWFVSSDYSGDVGAATWEVPIAFGCNRTFEEPAGGVFVYDPVFEGEPFAMARTSGDVQANVFNADAFRVALRDPGVDVNTGADYFSGVPFDYQNGDEQFMDYHDAQAADGEEIDEFYSDEYRIPLSGLTDWSKADINSWDLVYKVVAEITGSPDNNTTIIGQTLDVDVLDENDNVLQNKHAEAFVSSVNKLQNGGTFTLSPGSATGWTSGDEATLRVRTSASISLLGSGGTVEGALAVEVTSDSLNVGHSGFTGTLSTASEVDNGPRRVVWSDTFRPWDLPAENVVFAGEQGRVLRLQAVGQEVSTGQFGEYPIVCFSDNAVRVLRVSVDPFITSVDVLTTSMGVVGRRAAAVADGQVVAALDGGVYALSPKIQQPSLSRPLNDLDEEFLTSLGPDTAIGHYKDVQRGRNDAWVAAGGRVWSYSIDQGAWSALRRSRRDFAVRPGKEYAIRADGGLVREVAVEGEGQVHIQTAVLQTGPLGTLKRMRQAQLRQPNPMEEVDLYLVATDPEREYVKLDGETLRADEIENGIVPDAGLGTGFVLDIRGRALTGQSIEAIFVEYDVRNRTVRDHQAHEYPSYLDAGNLVKADESSTDLLYALVGVSADEPLFVLTSERSLE